MQDYSRPLGDAVKTARSELGSTQEQVASQIDADARTIINIENYKGNPKMETLFPLIRLLKIDAREIFDPEMQRESPAIRQLRLRRHVALLFLESSVLNYSFCNTCFILLCFCLLSMGFYTFRILHMSRPLPRSKGSRPRLL